jgi:hypothetical protein
MPSCQNGGTAVSTASGDYVCKCPDEFTGSSCQTSNLPECQNGGTVVKKADGTFACNCSSNFYGSNCESAHCQNGGSYTLNADGSSYRCTCISPNYGSTCEKQAPNGFEVLFDPNGNPVGFYNLITTPGLKSANEQACAQKGSTLAVITSAAENNAIISRIQSMSETDKKTCGQFATAGERNTISNCTAAKQYNFYWKPSGQPATPIVEGVSFTGWTSFSGGQPSCGAGSPCINKEKESCIGLWIIATGGKWNDYCCNSQPTCALCEKPLQ